ncbi:MAG TPA: porin [Rhodospirillaceae bacterium]|nr:porin [Rhodospirillaceae bacterium]
MKMSKLSCAMIACSLVGVGSLPARADDAAAAPDAAAPTSNAMTLPAMGGALTANANPASFAAGPLGKVYVTGVLSGLGLTQTGTVFGDQRSRADLSNGQVIVQTTEGLVQFYAQAGGYSLPVLGTSYLQASKMTNDTYGLVPVAFLKFAPSDSFSLMAGKLPTLIGTEGVFTYQNLNIERGLLWNQENVINTGIQANYTAGPLALSAAVSNGFYSNSMNWITGSATYTIDPINSVSVQAGGATTQNLQNTFSTPVLLNNSDIYDFAYTYNNAPWTITPYLQYTTVAKNKAIGANADLSTFGGALLASYAFPEESLAGVSLPVRIEYISSSSTTNGPNVLYGPSSNAWTFTVTPTYQKDIFFARAEASYVGVGGAPRGAAFGSNGNTTSQARLMAEVGLLF